MKKAIMIILQYLMVGYCFGQEIDQTALTIMQRSFDKLAAMKTIRYHLNFVDTMIRGKNPILVQQKQIEGIIEKSAYWHLLFENQDQWLIQDNKLYKKEALRPTSIDYTTDWNEHDLLKYSVYTIFGKKRPDNAENIAALKFVQEDADDTCYVIEILNKKRDFKTDEVIDVIHFSRYWIDKKSLLPLRRKTYGKSLQNGMEAIDIYDFSISFIPANQDAQMLLGFFGATIPIKEKADILKSLQPGTMAPDFVLSELKTGKVLKLNDLKGKVILLDFWYLSCMPCRILMPEIQKLHEKFSEESVAVIGINVMDTDKLEISTFLGKKGIRYSQYYKAESMISDYKLYAYPTTIVIGKDGKIKLVEIGMNENTPKKIEQQIDRELNMPSTLIPAKP